MKIRNGFVSNSSSSSYIIGAGRIKDIDKFQQYLLDNKMVKNDWNVFIGKIDDEKLQGSIFQFDKDILVATASVNSEPTVSTPVKDKESHYLLVSFGNDEGDGAFYNEEADELNYDIVNYNYFEDNQRKWIDVFSNKELIENGDCYYGAERNG